jgi:alkanesulfonate monooxygenase SsuD/methylene tetrahydromethanopterin reductase-like flavin-dependent oxidoreductase (luciferase family)
VNFDRVYSDPSPHRPEGIPIVIGGSSRFAASRAARLGDGFLPFTISPEDFRVRVAAIREEARALGRDPEAIEITAWPQTWDHTRTLDVDLARQYAECGVDRFLLGAADAEGRSDLESVRAWIETYQDRVLSRL